MKNFAAEFSFGSNLISVLKDKFTTGMKDSPIKDHLYEEETTNDLSDLVKIAMKKEAVIKTTKLLTIHYQEFKRYLWHYKEVKYSLN